jgi:hypothetical protein
MTNIKLNEQITAAKGHYSCLPGNGTVQLSQFWTLSNRPVFYFKHDVSETGFSLRPQVESTQVGPIDRAIVFLRTPATTLLGFIKSTQPPKRVEIFHTLNLHICGACTHALFHR